MKFPLLIVIRMPALSRLPRQRSKTQLHYYRGITAAIKYPGVRSSRSEPQWHSHLAAGAVDQGDQEAPALVAAGFCTNPLQ